MTRKEHRALLRITKAHEVKIEKLVNARLERLRVWFARNYSPRHKVVLEFGGGTCAVTWNGRFVMHWEDKITCCGREILPQVATAIKDVEEITNNYTTICPTDVVLEGEWKRGEFKQAEEEEI